VSYLRVNIFLTCVTCIILLVGGCRGNVYGQHTVSGSVVNSRDSLPIPNAVVSIANLDLWAVANEKGLFQLKGVPSGNAIVSVRYLGFVTRSMELNVNQDYPGLVISLNEDNLTLNEVTVTAQKNETSLNTSFVMDRTVLDHMQMLSVADATSLLPGGKTNGSLHLASGAQTISVIGTGSEMGNALFGVGVEVDGVRLSGNALPGLSGVDVRNIASSNVESVEVVNGIPSVEYGDATNGMVRINTRKGVSRFILDMAIKPNTKQIALSKGFDLKNNRGVLNFNIEHTRSISDLASPYTSYVRNSLSLNYSNAFGKQSRQPLELNAGITGNIGGYNNRSDPDRFVNTYAKTKDNVIRGNFSLKWLLNRSWITNIELTGTVNYNDKLSESQTNKSSSASVAAIHAVKEGYHVGQPYAVNPNAEIILINPGYWNELSFTDSKALNYATRLKATWNKRIGVADTRLLVGGEFTGSGNKGRGSYYGDMQYAPTWRAYRYDTIPFENNFAAFIEEKIRIPGPGRSGLDIVGGLRWDATSIKGSVYGLVSNFSPRFNAEYTFWKKSDLFVEDLSFKAGWGKTVKLPSMSTLFPTVNYRDYLTFAPGTMADGTTYYAYYSTPSTPIFNPDLKWQSNTQFELGLTAKVKGIKLLLIASRDKTDGAYSQNMRYTPFTYKFTDQSNLEKSAIPIANRNYAVDQQSGIVTVSDKTGQNPNEILAYKAITRFISNNVVQNGSPVVRNRIQWIADFPRIPAIRTQIRLDGNWYYYKGIDAVVKSYMPNATINMADGNPYKYVGFFVGGANASNGNTSKSLNMNLTATTHIPAIRLIFSTRIEGTLQNYSQALSQSSRGNRGFVLDNKEAFTASETKKDIYAGNQFVGVYPDYYVSLDDMSTPVPFEEKFLWAKVNDSVLYNELAKMVVKSNNV
jgi:outer membrane receptor protein involved in Fe transport